MPSAPTFRGFSTEVLRDINSNCNVTLPFYAPGDLLLAFGGGPPNTAGSKTITGGLGYSLIADSPTSTAGQATMTVWWKIAPNSFEVAPVLGGFTGGYGAMCSIIAGTFDPNDPFGVTPAIDADNVNNQNGPMPGLTTPRDNCLILYFIGCAVNAIKQTNFNTWGTPTGETSTERYDHTNTDGANGGFGMASWVKATAGPFPTPQNVAESSTMMDAMVTMCIQPPPRDDPAIWGHVGGRGAV